MKIKSIKKVPNEAVYNLTVDKYHNYITSSGLVLKNCDSLRYFCVNFTYNSEKQLEKKVQLPAALRTEEDYSMEGMGMVEW